MPTTNGIALTPKPRRGEQRGYPTQPKTCKCESAWLETDHCLRCGKPIEGIEPADLFKYLLHD